MRRTLAATLTAITVCLTLSVSAAQTPPDHTEVAFVANAEAGTVALVDVASRSIIGVLDINPARIERKGPGAPNYAQDTDVSPDGRTIYVSRGYLGDVAAFDLSSGKLLWQRSLNTGRADHMTITKDGRSLFVSALMDNRVYKLSAATGEISGHVVTGIYPHDNKVLKGWEVAVQLQSRSTRYAATSCECSAAHGETRRSVSADDCRRGDAGGSRSHQARQRFSSLALLAGREAHLRAALERARSRHLRSCEPQNHPSSRSSGKTRRDVRRLGFRSAASWSGVDG